MSLASSLHSLLTSQHSVSVIRRRLTHDVLLTMLSAIIDMVKCGFDRIVTNYTSLSFLLVLDIDYNLSGTFINHRVCKSFVLALAFSLWLMLTSLLFYVSDS